MNKLFLHKIDVSKLKLPCLIFGESGTGKTALAEQLVIEYQKQNKKVDFWSHQFVVNYHNIDVHLLTTFLDDYNPKHINIIDEIYLTMDAYEFAISARPRTIVTSQNIRTSFKGWKTIIDMSYTRSQYLKNLCALSGGKTQYIRMIGHRDARGRPSQLTKAKRRDYYVSDEDNKLLEEIGKGNASKGIRELIKLQKEQT